MDSVFLSSVSGTPPAAPEVPLVGFPRSGNSLTGEKATRPGPYWYHMITQELRNVLIAAGVTPNAGSLNQLVSAMQLMFAANGRSGHVYTDNDWTPLGGGLILQWVRGASVAAEGTQTVTFPVTFPNACLFAGAFNGGSDTASDGFFLVSAWTASGASVVQNNTGVAGASLRWPLVLAIGR